jgi:hypothetical protein
MIRPFVPSSSTPVCITTPQHLNADGAKVFSRMLAEEFAGVVKAKRGRSDE